MLKLPVLIGLLLLGLTSVGSASELEEFSRFRAVDVEGRRIDGVDASWDGSILRGETRDGDPVAIEREDLRLLDVRTGSHAGRFAAIGAGVGALLVLAAVIEVGSDPDAELRTGRAIGVGVGATAIGAGIGALTGRQQSKWRNVDLVPAVDSEPGPTPSVAIALRMNF